MGLVMGCVPLTADQHCLLNQEKIQVNMSKKINSKVIDTEQNITYSRISEMDLSRSANQHNFRIRHLRYEEQWLGQTCNSY